MKYDHRELGTMMALTSPQDLDTIQDTKEDGPPETGLTSALVKLFVLSTNNAVLVNVLPVLLDRPLQYNVLHL